MSFYTVKNMGLSQSGRRRWGEKHQTTLLPPFWGEEHNSAFASFTAIMPHLVLPAATPNHKVKIICEKLQR